MGAVLDWYLGHKPPSRPQQAAGQLDGTQREHGLPIGVLDPGGAHVGGTVVEHAVHLPGLELALQGLQGRAWYAALELTPHVCTCVCALQRALSANDCPGACTCAV